MIPQSDKPLKICNFCQKQVRNLGFHIANQHPKVLEQIDEFSAPTTPTPGANPVNLPQNPAPKLSINALINEKLETMLNIKIIEMLSKSPNTSLQEISQAINPPKSTPLAELKEMHDLLYPEGVADKIADIDTGNSWANVALQAIPIVQQMLPKRQQEEKQNVRERDTRSQGNLKPIQLEIAGSSGESNRPGEKPGIIGPAEQQDNRINPTA